MAVYKITSDKIFLKFDDAGVVVVYEIDDINTSPVKEKNWTHHGRIRVGGGKQYEGLKIGDKEITGADLQKLMATLSIFWRLLVNREGLCILLIEQSGQENEYYRMFDLFDWSKYEVRTSIMTRWVRSDIVDGRPLVPLSSSDHQEELDKAKRTHQEELDKAKRTHQEELDEAKRRHQEELDEAKRTHIQELDEAKRKHLEELDKEKGKHLKELEEEKRKHKEEVEEEKRKKDGEMAKKNKEIEYLEDVVILFDPTKQEQRTYAVYARVVPRFVTLVPSTQVTLMNTSNRTVHSELPPTDRFPYTVNPVPISLDPSSCRGIIVSESYDTRFDCDNWKAIKISNEKAIAFYIGSKYGHLTVNNGQSQVGLPCPTENLPYLSNFAIKNVRAIGIKFVLDYLI